MSTRRPYFYSTLLSTLFIIGLFNNHTSLFSQDINWDTAIVAKGSGSSIGVKVILDSVMNSIVMTSGQGVVIIGSDTLNSQDKNSYSFTYYDSLQNIRWTKSISGKYLWINRGGMTFDNKGALYAAGQFTDTLFAENKILTSNKILEGFIVKYNKQGKLIWLKKIASGRTILNLALNADKSNRIFIGGNFTDSLSIGGKNMVSIKRPYNQTAFVARLDTAGNAAWVNTILMSDFDDFFGLSDVDADDKGNVYITGSFNYVTDPDFGNGKILTGFYPERSFIAKYDAAGNCLWVKTPESGGNESFGISVDNCGYVYNTGMYLGTLVYGADTLRYPHALPPSGYHGATIYIVKYDKDGNYKRSATYANTGSNDDFGVKYVSTNCCKQGYLLGLFNDTLVIGYDSLKGTLKPVQMAADNVFLAKFDSTFKPLWARNCSNVANDQQGGDIAVDTAQRIYFAGYSSTTDSRSLYALKSCALIDTTVAPPPKPVDTTHKPGPVPDTIPDPGPISKTDMIVSSCTTSVYPVPANEQITVTMPCSNEYKISIIDVNGQTVYMKVISDSSETMIDVSIIPPGNYFVQLNDRHLSKIYRCVIER